MRILKGNEINMQSWENLFQDSPISTFFQSPECYRFYAELSFLSPFVYAVEEEGELTALVCGYLIAEKGLIKSCFSRRAIIPGGALLAKNVNQQSLYVLLSALKSELRQLSVYIEFRNYLDYSKYKDIFVEAGFIYKPHLNFHLKIENYETLWGNLGTNRKREILKSNNAGLVCVETKNEDDIISLYSILLELYSKKVKRPLFPMEFFVKLGSESFAKIFTVKNREEIIGGIVCVVDKNVVYEWFVCGVSEMSQYPQTLATWTAIKFALENGFNKFDFMGAGSPEKKYGVRDYKSRFGGEEVEYGRFLYVSKPRIYKMLKFLIELI